MFADGGRLHDRAKLDVGPVLHPDDLAADKMLALWGQARPRDFFDVAALIDRYGHDRLLELAEAKDSGFTQKTFIDTLRTITRLGNADWVEDGLSSDDAQRLRINFDAWRNQLELDAK